MDQGWIRAGHIQGDVLGPFSGSGMAIRERHRAPNWPQNAINGPFVAIRHPGGSKLVDQYGSRLDQGGAHPGDGLVPFIPPEIVIWGPYRGPKWPKLAINGAFLAKSAPGVTSLPEARSAMQ